MADKSYHLATTQLPQSTTQSKTLNFGRAAASRHRPISRPKCRNVLSGVFLLCGTLVHADVLVVGDNGFVPYQNAGSLLAFGRPDVETDDPVTVSATNVAPPAVRVVTPRADILDAIHEIGFRYAGDRAVANAGLTATQWVALFRSNIQIESAFNENALSPVGAIGLGQLMPDTARQLGVDPYNLSENLDGSARYLLAMLRQFGSSELALAAYNAGPNAVERHGGIPPYRETQNHVRRVMAVFNQTIGN